jgi:AraC family transcriptional regulator
VRVRRYAKKSYKLSGGISMEFKITQRTDILLVGMGIDVTLTEVQTSKKTKEHAERFINRRTEINHFVNNREVFGLSTDPENYNPSKDKFEYFIGIEVSESA